MVVSTYFLAGVRHVRRGAHRQRELEEVPPDGKGSRKNNFTFLCVDASCLAVLPKRRNISICLRFGALPDSRLNT